MTEELPGTSTSSQPLHAPPPKTESPSIWVYTVAKHSEGGQDLAAAAVKSNSSLGPKWFRILSWIARATVYMNPQHKKWSIERFNAEVDKAMRDFLTEKEEIS